MTSVAPTAGLVLLALAARGPFRTQDEGPRPADAPVEEPVQAILRAFERHQLVLFGETHGSAPCHAVLQALVRDPAFRSRVDDVVVEFGNPLYQDLVDRYVAGEDVPLEELQHAWRDTAVPMAWDAPVYRAFFKAVRAVHAARGPGEDGLRLVLGGEPIDWARVETPADYEPYADRSGNYYRTVVREVLSGAHRALLVVGGMHVLRREQTNGFAAELPRNPGVGQLLEHHHPGQTFAIWPFYGFHEPGRARSWESPSLVPLAGTALGAESFGVVAPGNVMVQRLVDGEPTWVPLESDAWPRLEVMVDALLYLGRDEGLVPPPAGTYRDAAYARELERRCRIVDSFYGYDFYAPDLQKALSGAESEGR